MAAMKSGCARKTGGKRAGRAAPGKAVVRALTRAQVPGAVAKMAEPKGTARFAAGKALVVTAEKAPERVYPHFDEIAELLAGESKIVRWNAMQIVARLAGVDKDGRVEGVLDAYLAFIHGGNLISAANAIDGAARIALARPYLMERVLPALLGVERETYETPECRNVAIGQVLDALARLWPMVQSRAEVVAFIRRQQNCTRAAVARKAQRMLAGRA
jgi:hypothetical protein